MLRAGALYYAIFIAFVIALACIAMLMNSQLHRAIVIQYSQSERLERNINSALILINEDPTLIKLNETKEIQLYENEDDVVTATKKRWGVFSLLKISTFWGQKEFSKIALTGNDLSTSDHVALYLTDKERYLSISGSTLLKGNCFLPAIGIRRAYIEGKSFQSDNLVEGTMGKSAKELPQIDLKGIEEEIRYISRNTSSVDSIIPLDGLLSLGKLSHSFYKRTLTSYSDDWIYLNHQNFKGNIRIVSSKGIIVDKSTMLDNIILLAPKVEIKPEFIGSVQIFATDTLIIGEKCSLLSPSALIMLSSIEKSRLIISNQAHIKGDIVVVTKDAQQKIKPELKLLKGSKVEGQVYVNGLVQMEGIVWGSLYCNGFVLRTPGATYENHLLDAVIDYTALSPNYTGMDIFPINLKNKTLEWLE